MSGDGGTCSLPENDLPEESAGAEPAGPRLMAHFIHELRGSLTVASLISYQLATEQPSPQVLELRAELRRIHRILDTASQLIQVSQGLDRPEPLNLARLARQEVARFTSLAKKNGQKLRYSGARTLPVRGDEAQLRWLIHHLLHNALQYTPAGGQIVCRWAKVQRPGPEHEWPGSERLPPEPPDWATLRVSDTGAGIPPAELPQLFEPFFRGAASAQTAGAGLGLTLVRAILQAHDGHLGVASAPGRGSSFVVYLPLER